MPGPIPAGRRAYTRVTVQTPTETPDGIGGYTEVWTSQALPWDVAIDAFGGSGERVAAGTVIAQGTLTVVGPYRGDISMKSRLVRPDGTLLRILSVVKPDGRALELQLSCAEVQT